MSPTTTCTLPDTCINALLNADSKALASYGDASGVHVVPVSSIRVADGKIILVNYFLGQTLQNLIDNPSVSLACWKGLEGYQIKATAVHETDGPLFEEVVAWIRETIPSRTVKGVIVLTPKEFFDVSVRTAPPEPSVVE